MWIAWFVVSDTTLGRMGEVEFEKNEKIVVCFKAMTP
jgi:hypothetical protein